MDRRDWVQWHRQYDDAESSLSRRLDTIVDCIEGILDAKGAGPIRLLSICAGRA